MSANYLIGNFILIKKKKLIPQDKKVRIKKRVGIALKLINAV